MRISPELEAGKTKANVGWHEWYFAIPFMKCDRISSNVVSYMTIIHISTSDDKEQVEKVVKCVITNYPIIVRSHLKYLLGFQM